jgi:integrase
MTTLQAALEAADHYWQSKGPSSRMMSIRANACASVLGGKQRVELIGPPEATRVLTHLQRTKSKGSVPVYYAAFKRVVAMAGGNVGGWPKPGSAPRKCREPLSEADIDSLALKLIGRVYVQEGKPPDHYVSFPISKKMWQVRCGGWETFDLLELLRGTGMRVAVEALNPDAWQWNARTKVLHITGKGQHERRIAVERLETVELLNNPERLRRMRKLSYSGHLKRWQAALDRLQVSSLKPTPHAVRHYYATRAYHQSGKNLRLVQELLGHVDIGTTARYLGVDVEEMRHAVG